MNQYVTTITEKQEIATDVLQIRTTKPEGFSFIPGQFVQWTLEGTTPIIRSYSISSTPDKPYIEYCIKLLPNGKASTFIKEAALGTPLHIRGPNGKFTYTNTHNTPSYYIATGTGLAPIIGIIEHELMYKQNVQPIQLFFGIRRTQDIFWENRLEILKNTYTNFSFHICLSQETESHQYKKGRVTEALPINILGKYFVCGNKEMVIDVRKKLIEAHVPPTNISFEIF